MLKSQALFFALLALFVSTKAQAGYTHYFTWHQKPDQTALQQCTSEMSRVIEAQKGILAGPEGTGSPEIGATTVHFNGRGDDAHEPFDFPGDEESGGCKTASKPYDAVVTACLLIARDHFSSSILTIESDGSWDDGDWREGAKLYSSVLSRPASNPMREGGSIPPARGRFWELAPGALTAAPIFWLWKKRSGSKS